MTVANLTSRGSGSLAFRISIEGFPVEFVSSARLVGTGSDGRERALGLSMKNVKIKQEADLPRATLKSGSVTFTIADIGGRATAAFDTSPTATTWLDSDLTASATTATVKSTELFAVSGVFYLDSEVISYTGKTGTTFTGCTRGRYDTLAAAHYAADGGYKRYPEITDEPTVLEGRRVRLYVYTAEDSGSGDGEQVWLGVVRGEPRMEGPKWSFFCDPISAILDGEIGADLADPARPRGIYLPTSTNAHFVMYLERNDANGTIPIFASSTVIEVAGFFETQDDFIERVNLLIAEKTSAWNTKVFCVRDARSYHFEIQTTATIEGVNLRTESAPCEPRFGNRTITENTQGLGQNVNELEAVKRYYVWPVEYPMPGAGEVPRGAFGQRADVVLEDGTVVSEHVIYIDGAVAVPSNVTAATVTWSSDTGSVDREYIVESVDTSNRSLTLFRSSPNPPPGAADEYVYTKFNLPSIRMGRSYNDLTVGSASTGKGTYDLMASLEANAPDQVNTGGQPMIQGDDWNAVEWFQAYDTVAPVAGNRQYTSLKPGKLIEYIAPDLQLHGHYLAFDSAGRLTIKRLQLSAPNASATYQITKSNLITSKGMPTFERGAIGIFNTVIIRNGYSAKEDDYTLPPFVVRDVASYGRSPATRAITIEPKSELYGTFINGEMSPDDGVRIAQGVLGIYGNPYGYVTCTVPLTALTLTTLGSTVSISSDQLPNGMGTRGTTDAVGIVTARDINFLEGTISLTLLVSRARIGGYAPCAKIDSQSGSGTTWTITLASVYFLDGDLAANHFEADDRVAVLRYDSETPGIIEGTVTGATSNNVSVTFDSAWTPSTDEWILTAADANNNTLSDGQTRYVYMGLADAAAEFNGISVNPYVFAP